MTFWSYMGHRAVAVVFAIITVLLGFTALTLPLIGSGLHENISVTFIVILWILTIGSGIASSYFFKTQH